VFDGRGGNIEEADLTVGAREPEAARCEVEVGFRGVEQNARAGGLARVSCAARGVTC
jgi:hypothetical protein